MIQPAPEYLKPQRQNEISKIHKKLVTSALEDSELTDRRGPLML